LRHPGDQTSTGDRAAAITAFTIVLSPFTIFHLGQSGKLFFGIIVSIKVSIQKISLVVKQLQFKKYR
jgi:hypothetical protein